MSDVSLDETLLGLLVGVRCNFFFKLLTAFNLNILVVFSQDSKLFIIMNYYTLMYFLFFLLCVRMGFQVVLL